MEEEKTTEIQRKVNPVEVLNKIHEQLSGFSREPFRNELGRFLCFSPSDEAIQAHANKSPDRWSQAVTILARLSGITDKVADPDQSDSFHNINNLTLQEKQMKLAEIEGKIKDELKKALERKGVIVDPDTLEEISIFGLHNDNWETERPGTEYNRP